MKKLFYFFLLGLIISLSLVGCEDSKKFTSFSSASDLEGVWVRIDEDLYGAYSYEVKGDKIYYRDHEGYINSENFFVYEEEDWDELIKITVKFEFDKEEQSIYVSGIKAGTFTRIEKDKAYYKDCSGLLKDCSLQRVKGVKSQVETDEDEPEGGGSTSGKSNGHNYVDLGLSVKWATCNVGASILEEYGVYFAWGETAPKGTYNWSNYFDTNDGGDTFMKYKDGGKTVLDPEDDAAHVNWGGSWRTPTKAEWQELIECCTWVWTMHGYKVTSNKEGYADKFIFLPAAGRYEDGLLHDVGSDGYYWSSSLDEDYSDYSDDAWSLGFGSGHHSLYHYDYRYYGLSVRPVLP